MVTRLWAASLEIYLIHSFVLNRVEILMGNVNAMIVLGFGMLLSIVLGILIHWVFEKIVRRISI